MDSAQSQLADFVALASFNREDQKTIFEVFCDLFLDTLAVSVAGLRTKVAAQVVNYAESHQSDQTSTVLAANLAFHPEAASLVGGAIAHALDFDDVTSAWRGHPSAVMIPALLACANVCNSSGQEVANAYAVGYEVGGWLGRNIGNSHYRKGWHSTSTIGVVAATAACCRLKQLNDDQTCNALGFSVAQSAGTRASFGTSGKAINAGLAAAAAVRSTQLAAAGLANSALSFDGPYGFTSLYGTHVCRSTDLSGLVEAPLILRNPIMQKAYPNCYATHRAISATLHLKSQYRIHADDVESVDVISTPGSHDPLLKALPRDESEALFSMHYAVASVLLDGDVVLNTFSPRKFGRARVRELMKKITVQEREDHNGGRSSTVVITTTSSGELRYSASRIETGGNTLRKKLVECFSYGDVSTNLASLEAELHETQSKPIAELQGSTIMAELRKQGRDTLRRSIANSIVVPSS